MAENQKGWISEGFNEGDKVIWIADDDGDIPGLEKNTIGVIETIIELDENDDDYEQQCATILWDKEDVDHDEFIYTRGQFMLYETKSGTRPIPGLGDKGMFGNPPLMTKEEREAEERALREFLSRKF